MDETIGTLSEGQKSCLRLVAAGMSSKEIAIETGLTHHTVDTYVKTAMARLGASNRRDAARMLRDSETSQKSGSPSPDVAATGSRSADGSQAVVGGRDDPLLPPLGGRRNELSATARSVAILKVAVLAAASLAAIALLIAGIIQTFR